MIVTPCSTGSPGPAHLLADLEHGLVLTANYGGGTLTLFSLTQQGAAGQAPADGGVWTGLQGRLSPT